MNRTTSGHLNRSASREVALDPTWRPFRRKGLRDRLQQARLEANLKAIQDVIWEEERGFQRRWHRSDEFLFLSPNHILGKLKEKGVRMSEKTLRKHLKILEERGEIRYTPGRVEHEFLKTFPQKLKSQIRNMLEREECYVGTMIPSSGDTPFLLGFPIAELYAFGDCKLMDMEGLLDDLLKRAIRGLMLELARKGVLDTKLLTRERGWIGISSGELWKAFSTLRGKGSLGPVIFWINTNSLLNFLTSAEGKAYLDQVMRESSDEFKEISKRLLKA